MIIVQTVTLAKPYLRQVSLSLVLILSCVFLSGCQILRSHQMPSVTPDSVDKIMSWTARGKMMLADKKEKISGYFYWQQENEDFSFSLDTIIGTNLFSLEYKDGISTVKVNGKTYQGTDPQPLIYKLTGHQLPINNMADWLLGRIKEKKSGATYDENNRITAFRYTNNTRTWLINYASWKSIPPLVLPNKLNLSSNTNRVKISVSDWNIRG